jgi:hypothetical protein
VPYLWWNWTTVGPGLSSLNPKNTSRSDRPGIVSSPYARARSITHGQGPTSHDNSVRALPAATTRPEDPFRHRFGPPRDRPNAPPNSIPQRILPGPCGSLRYEDPGTTELFSSRGLNSVAVCLLCEVRFRWRARRIKPSADIDPGVGFPTVVTRSRSARRNGVPFEHGKFGSVALDHKPVSGTAGNPTADFASEFLKRGHGFCILPFCSLERCSLASLIIQIPAALYREIDRKGAFPIVDPLAASPMFLAMARDDSPGTRRVLAWRVQGACTAWRPGIGLQIFPPDPWSEPLVLAPGPNP